MTEKERLLRTLFETEGRTHLNIKFCRGTAEDISPEALCLQANLAIFQIESGMAETSSTFGDKERNIIDVTEL